MAVDRPDKIDADEDEPAGMLCATCGHPEDEHVVEDIEGEVDDRVRCLTCGDRHNFVPRPEDL